MKLKPEQVVAVVDTRAQRPLDLSPLQMVRGALRTGDYALKALPRECVVERKSETDLVSCVGRYRRRFDREIDRMLAYRCRVLLVESTWQRIEKGDWNAQLTSSQVMGSLMGWAALGITVLMADNHARASRFTSQILFTVARRRHRELRKLLAPTG